MGSTPAVSTTDRFWMISKYRDKLIVLFLYLLAALVVTYPLVLNLFSSYHFFQPVLFPRDNPIGIKTVALSNDTLLDIWTHWFFRKSIISGKSPWSTELFYGVPDTPVGASINNWVSPILSLLLHPVLGTVGSFNFQTIFTFVLNGFSAYILIERFVKSRIAAFLGGLFILSSAYVYLRSQDHLGLSSIFPLIFFFYFFWRSSESRKFKDWIFCGLVLSLSGLFSWYYLFYGLTVSFILLAYHWFFYKESRVNILFGCKVVASTLALTLAPFFVLFLFFLRKNFLGTTYEGSFNFSADLLSLILPNPAGMLWGNLTAPVYSKILFKFTSPIEKETGYLGVLGITSAVYYFLRVKSREKTSLLLIFLSGVILSLGPYLTILGHPYIPLPYIVLSVILPFLQSPNRFIVFALIAETIFVGKLLDSFFGRIKNRILSVTLVLAISAYFLLENTYWPYPLNPYNFDNPFYRDLRQRVGKSMILNLPVSYQVGWGNIYYLSQQTFFSQPMINGYSAPIASFFIRRTPYYDKNLHPLACQFDLPVNGQYAKDFSRYIDDHKIEYILVQKQILEQPICGPAARSIEFLKRSGILSRPVYEDNLLSAYRVGPPSL